MMLQTPACLLAFTHRPPLQCWQAHCSTRYGNTAAATAASELANKAQLVRVDGRPGQGIVLECRDRGRRDRGGHETGTWDLECRDRGLRDRDRGRRNGSQGIVLECRDRGRRDRGGHETGTLNLECRD